ASYAFGADHYNALGAAVRKGKPAARLAAVEPWADFLDGMLAAGGRPDMVMGEDYTYGGGDVRMPKLAALRQQYGVGVGQWITGADRIATYSGNVDLLVTADWDEQPQHLRYYEDLQGLTLGSCSVA